MVICFTCLSWQSYAEQAATKTFSKAEIEQLVAPIALYPDPLLAQILMAATYPLETIAAANWLKENPNLKGDAFKQALQHKSWDASVKSLTAIPDVLNKLSEKLEMTIKLGDAVLAQKEDVLNAIQDLRRKAQTKGYLQSSNEQVVSAVPAESSQNAYIAIEPTNPDLIYYPTYDPNRVYGEWPYTDYPPDYYYPAGYAYTPGVALAYSLGYLLSDAAYGNIEWNGQGITINVNRYYEFTGEKLKDKDWQHDSTHRKGLPYRDADSQKKYAQAQLQSQQVREAFRGHQAIKNTEVDSLQQKISTELTQQEQRFYGPQGSHIDKQIHSQDIQSLSQQRADHQQDRQAWQDNRADRQQRIAERREQARSEPESEDLRQQREQFREQQRKQDIIQQQQQEAYQHQQAEREQQRIALQEQRREQQEQRAEQQGQRREQLQQRRQPDQPRFQSHQVQEQIAQRQQHNARERFAERQPGNAFDGIHNAAQARQYSQRGSQSLASGRVANRPAAAHRGAHGGGRRR